MTKYVALLRGISPLNPNMRNEKLREVFVKLGFENVKTVISTGNVIFETDAAAASLEEMIEDAIFRRLGFKSSTIVRSESQLNGLVTKDIFKGYEHTKEINLAVTFLKRKPTATLSSMRMSESTGYKILGMYDQAVFSVVDLTGTKTPLIMSRLEKEFGKEITTRTWKTVERIIKKF